MPLKLVSNAPNVRGLPVLGTQRPLAPKRSLDFRKCRRLTLLGSSDPNKTAATETAQSTIDPDLACFGVGAEVECVVSEYVHDHPSNGSMPTGMNSNKAAPNAASVLTEATPLARIVETVVLISPFFFWGTSMVAMKELSPHTTPLFMAAWRLIPAGIALVAWAASTGRKQPDSGMAWLAIALFGLADGACFQGFLAEGLQRTSAGLGSVIIDSQPLTVAVLASLLFGERLGPWGVAGLGLGVVGLLMLEVPPSVLTSLPDVITSTAGTAALETAVASSDWSIWDSGEWWMLLAAQSMAIGTVMVRWVAKYCDPVIATGWHMILGGIPLVILALTQDTSGELPARLAQLTAPDVWWLIYVSLLGSAASYGVFFYEATVRGNLTALSSLTFLTPMFAAAGGYVALGESLTPLQLAGATVTLGAVTLLNSGNGENKSESKKEGDKDNGTNGKAN